MDDMYFSFRLFTRPVMNEERLKEVSPLRLPNTGGSLRFLLPASIVEPCFDFSGPDGGGLSTSFPLICIASFPIN